MNIIKKNSGHKIAMVSHARACQNKNNYEDENLPKDKATLVFFLMRKWLEIGNKNAWIRESMDPPFNVESFCPCLSREDLQEKFEHGNWCLGQAFYYLKDGKGYCFINQINGGDEWLVIRNCIQFESVTMAAVIRDGKFEDFLDRIEKATDSQLARLEY